MKVFRSHIAKLLLSGLIWSGIGLYLVRPVQAQTASNDFAEWLETVVKKDEAGVVQKQVYQLKESERSLESVIHRASEIVRLYNEDFNLPIRDKDTDSDKVYSMLVQEWSSYQTGSGMGKASIPGSFKLSHHPTVDKLTYSFEGGVQRRYYATWFVAFEKGSVTEKAVTNHIEPLADGIAIGAP